MIYFQESLPLLKTKVVLGGSNGGSPMAQPDWERPFAQQPFETTSDLYLQADIPNAVWRSWCEPGPEIWSNLLKQHFAMFHTFLPLEARSSFLSVPWTKREPWREDVFRSIKRFANSLNAIILYRVRLLDVFQFRCVQVACSGCSERTANAMCYARPDQVCHTRCVLQRSRGEVCGTGRRQRLRSGPQDAPFGHGTWHGEIQYKKKARSSRRSLQRQTFKLLFSEPACTWIACGSTSLLYTVRVYEHIWALYITLLSFCHALS